MNHPIVFSSKDSSERLESLEEIEVSLMVAKKMKTHLFREIKEKGQSRFVENLAELDHVIDQYQVQLVSAAIAS